MFVSFYDGFHVVPLEKQTVSLSHCVHSVIKAFKYKKFLNIYFFNISVCLYVFSFITVESNKRYISVF